MSIYNIALFLHVSGAIGYFVGMGTWLFGFAAMRRAQRVEQVRALTNLTGRLGPLAGISVLLILATGLYMAITAWGFRTGWIPVALVSLILIAPLGTAFIEPRRRAIARLAQEATDGPLPQSLQQRIHDPILGTALQTVTILLLGIVFLMTNKPEFVGSLIVMAVALVLGLASGLLFSRATRTRQQPEAANMNREREPVR
jgi:ABC-type bacteriocin/lantibiotic exporter with double-glycine peptidase domain